MITTFEKLKNQQLQGASVVSMLNCDRGHNKQIKVEQGLEMPNFKLSKVVIMVTTLDNF